MIFPTTIVKNYVFTLVYRCNFSADYQRGLIHNFIP